MTYGRLKTTLSRRSQLKRKLERKGISLKSCIVNSRTLAQYSKAVLKFLDWLRACGRSAPTSLSDLDGLVSDYICFLWEDGDTIGTAGNTISGLQHFYSPCRKHLYGSWHLFSAWRKRELPAQAPPLPLLFMFAFVGRMISLRHIGVAAAWSVGWHCFLRTHEFASLIGSDVVLGPVSGAVILPITKKGIRDSVAISDPLVINLSLLRKAEISAGESFAGADIALIRKYFAECISFFGLRAFDFRLYSVRRGGATHFFKNSGNMEQTLVRGRWESARTARIYLTEGMASLADCQINGAALSKIRAYAAIAAALR